MLNVYEFWRQYYLNLLVGVEAILAVRWEEHVHNLALRDEPQILESCQKEVGCHAFCMVAYHLGLR